MRLSVRLKFIVAVVLCLLASMTIGMNRLNALETLAFEQEVHNRTTLLSEFGKAAQAYVNEDLRPATEAQSDEFIIEAMSAPYVTRNIFENLKAALPEYTYRQPTLNPLNPIDLADEFEAKLIQQFQINRTLPELSGYLQRNGHEQFYVAKPVKVVASCLQCHGLPSEAPAAITQRYGQLQGYHWKIGEIVSALMIYVPTFDLRAEQAAATQTILGTFALITLFVLGVIALLFEIFITRRIIKIGRALQQQAHSPNSTVRLHDSSKDELGALSSQFNHMADALDQAYQTLESKVSDRTQALSQTVKKLKRTQAQLIHSEKMSSLGKMVGGIAHEINNPVNFIHGNLKYTQEYTQTLTQLIARFQSEIPQKQLSPDLQTAIEEAELPFLEKDLNRLMASMKIGSSRIQKIVLELRNFARLDESAQKTVNLHEGIDSALLIVRQRLEATERRAAIELVKSYGELPEITCFPGQLNQVILHVLNNAIDAVADVGSSSTGTDLSGRTPRISIKTAAVKAGYQISITDNGHGITDDIRPSIFDPFFTTKPIGTGTGLGLAISHQIIVETHQGKLHCDSIPGESTTLTILLPLAQN